MKISMSMDYILGFKNKASDLTSIRKDSKFRTLTLTILIR